MELGEITRGREDRFPHFSGNVPGELKIGECWVTCDEWKVPLVPIPNGTVYAACSTDPDTWRDYETALATYSENEHIAGVGRVIADEEEYVGVDLDDCITEEGELSPWASHILERLHSYAEISPSMTGVKFWVRAPEVTRAYKKPGLEIYPRSRYFSVTGVTFEEALPIRDASAELAAIIEEEFRKVDRCRSRNYDGPTRHLDLYELLERSSIEVFEEDIDKSGARRFIIRCPWCHEHTGGDASGTRTGQYENGALFFVCEHAHCSHRDWGTFRHYLEALIYLGRPPRTERGRLR